VTQPIVFNTFKAGIGRWCLTSYVAHIHFFTRLTRSNPGA